MTARVLKPSDVVVWRDRTLVSNGVKSTLEKRGTATRFVDSQDSNNTTGYFKVEYFWTGEGAPNPEANDWFLVTEGANVGGRRYRHWLTLEQCQRKALAWLDRRFTAVDANTGERIPLS